MKASTLLEIMIAAHLSAFVDGTEFPERGGIMLIAPPGQMKSTLIKNAMAAYGPQALVLSDINVETLNRLKSSIVRGHVRTLALPAFEKIYERNPQTSSNIEGHLKAMVDEGFSLASFEDSRMLGQSEARCLVIGGMVDNCYKRHFSAWKENGLVRRFIWSFFKLEDDSVLTKAIHEWKRLELEVRAPFHPAKQIKMNVTEQESNELRKYMVHQDTEATPYALMKKILAVLKWKFNRAEDIKQPMNIMKDFSTSLGTKMTNLTL